MMSENVALTGKTETHGGSVAALPGAAYTIQWGTDITLISKWIWMDGLDANEIHYYSHKLLNSLRVRM